jgi:hypothetical protein
MALLAPAFTERLDVVSVSAMVRRLLGLGAVALVSLSGCGGVHYAVNANGAASRLEEAKQLGAEQLAPYEYYYAKANLEQAQIEASEASYSDAANFAETAEEFASKAVELSKSSKKGGQAPESKE